MLCFLSASSPSISSFLLYLFYLFIFLLTINKTVGRCLLPNVVVVCFFFFSHQSGLAADYDAVNVVMAASVFLYSCASFPLLLTEKKKNSDEQIILQPFSCFGGGAWG